MIKKIIKQTFDKLGYELKTKKGIEKQDPFLKYFGRSIPEKFSFCKNALEYIENISSINGVFYIDENLFRIDVCGALFEVDSWEELIIIHEVYYSGTYNVELQNDQDFILIDIGMNVGITSIYMSNKQNCKHIYAFEPFDETRLKAKTNFSLNKNVDKVRIYEFGLGYPERTLQVEYSTEFKGSVGINGVASYISKDLEKKAKPLCIKDASHVLTEIIDNTSLNVVIKIDCEGAEYEILNRLFQTGLLRKVDIIMIEWHNKGPYDLLAILKKENFSIISLNPNDKNVGMIYAFNKNK